MSATKRLENVIKKLKANEPRDRVHKGDFVRDSDDEDIGIVGVYWNGEEWCWYVTSINDGDSWWICNTDDIRAGISIKELCGVSDWEVIENV